MEVYWQDAVRLRTTPPAGPSGVADDVLEGLRASAIVAALPSCAEPCLTPGGPCRDAGHSPGPSALAYPYSDPMSLGLEF